MRNADESQKSKHDKRCAMTVATRVSSAGRASDAHRDRQVFHQKHGHMPRIPPVQVTAGAAREDVFLANLKGRPGGTPKRARKPSLAHKLFLFA